MEAEVDFRCMDATDMAAFPDASFASLFDTAQVARAQLELEDEAARLAEHLL